MTVATSMRITLLGDGPSDRCLLTHILWVIGNHLESQAIIEPAFISVPRMSHDRGLTTRVQAALQEAPCDILFVHRDAERESYTTRLKEIQNALNGVDGTTVPIVPVRMTEAWLLFDQDAIRLAADNPNGRVRLGLPRIRDIEKVADPKRLLAELLCTATEKSGRRLDQFKRDIASRVHRVAEIIKDFSPLRALGAFQRFEMKHEKH